MCKPEGLYELYIYIYIYITETFHRHPYIIYTSHILNILYIYKTDITDN